MKRITFLTVILSLITIKSFAQLNVATHEEYAGYKTVWKAPMGYGEIRYMEPSGTYVICGSTNNKFEEKMATIILGDTKESTNLSLDDLYKICTKETKIPKEGVVVKGWNDKKTEIYFTMNGPTIKSDYVAGESFILFYIKKRFDEVKKAIEDFEE